MRSARRAVAFDVSFFHGQDLLGHFSVGRDFLSTFACNEFWTHSISPGERAALLRLLSVGNPEDPLR
jgi:hypothetical protein